MLGSDIALYNALSNGGFMTDTYVVDDHAYPMTDDCQNWNYISARGEIFPDYVSADGATSFPDDINDGWIILELTSVTRH
jgi:hypothetical protein